MAQFNKDQFNNFLGVIRKYMQVRGNLNQKELAEKTDLSVSVISRFLNEKTRELDPQVIAKIVAKLEIPLHEIIDFVEEGFTEKFKKLVKFYKDEDVGEPEDERENNSKNNDDNNSGTTGEKPTAGTSSSGKKAPDPLEEALGSSGTARKTVNARVRIGDKTANIPFMKDEGDDGSLSVKDKLARLTPRQKAYVTDFLNLDLEGRDLIVDLGNSLFRYFKQKGVDY
jgi:transcriptional regulator with XRE-family HTH domain